MLKGSWLSYPWGTCLDSRLFGLVADDAEMLQCLMTISLWLVPMQMQISPLVEACRLYMCDTLKDCEPAWAWAVFTIAQQLESLEDVVKAAASELVCAALTKDSCVSKASAAIRRGTSGSSSAVQLSNQLECVREGISRAVHGAKNPSQALLVVLLMRLYQLADDETSSSSSAANADLQLLGDDGDQLASDETSSSSIAANADLQLLGDDGILALLKLVKWDALHHVEVSALLSQSRSYKAGAAAAYVKEQLLQQTLNRMLQDSALKMDSLPPGQPNLQYLAGWVKSSDMNNLPAQANANAVVSRENLPVTGIATGLKSDRIKVQIWVQRTGAESKSTL